MDLEDALFESGEENFVSESHGLGGGGGGTTSGGTGTVTSSSGGLLSGSALGNTNTNSNVNQNLNLPIICCNYNKSFFYIILQFHLLLLLKYKQ